MDLAKMFVLVTSTSSATVDSIKTASLTSGKIYFMAKYNQIVAKGTVYGVDPTTGQELESIVSVLGGSKGGDGAVTVDFSNLNYYTSEGTKTIIGAIEAIDAKIKSEMDKLAASKTLNDNYEFTGQLTYVAATEDVPAHIALVNEDGTELSNVPVSEIIGSGILKTHEYNAETGILYLTFVGTDQVIEVDLKAMLDINDISIAEASRNYLEVTLGTSDVEGETQAVFGAKIVKVVEASDAKTGLVDAKDVKDYIDGKATDLAVTAEGDDYVGASVNADVDKKHVIVATNIKDVTYTAGTHTTYDAAGAKLTEAVAATISGEAKSLVDGAQATTAIKSYVDFVVAEEALRSDAKVVSAINALDKPSSTVDGTNIHINYKEEDGIVTIESVTEDYATVSSTDENFSINRDDLRKLVRGSDLIESVSYASNYTQFSVSYFRDMLNTYGNIIDNEGTGYINCYYIQKNGLSSINHIDTQYAYVGVDKTLADGIVTGECLNDVLENIWETFEG